MFCVEILALCGITQMMMTSYLFKPLRTNMPMKWWRHTISSPLCMGFWVGFFVYGTVALCPPDIEHSFPLAAAVATSTHVYIQWTLAFFLGGLVGLCVVLAAQIFEAEQDREDQAKDSALDPLEPDPNDPIPHTPKYAKEPEKYSLVEVPRSCRLYNLFVQFNE